MNRVCVNLRRLPVALAMLMFCLPPLHAQGPPRGTGWMPVTGPVRVIEANTLEIQVDGRRVGVAVAGILAPPGNTACGLEAIAAAEELVADGIELQEDLGLPTINKRLLRVYRVSLASGRSLAEELALGGYAKPDPDAKTALEHLSILGAADAARVSGRGCVWQVDSPQ
jgi:hypothetical protein